jgi:hypothetical protein
MTSIEVSIVVHPLDELSHSPSLATGTVNKTFLEGQAFEALSTYLSPRPCMTMTVEVCLLAAGRTIAAILLYDGQILVM